MSENGQPLTLSAGKRDLVLDPVWMNAAGTLGFSDEAARFLDLSRLGALVTNPISLAPRSPARPPRAIAFSGGLLLHTGLPNPGLGGVLRLHRERWARLPLPVIAHVLAGSPEEADRIASRLETVDEIAALEVGLEPFGPSQAEAILAACAVAQKPILAGLPVTSSAELVAAAANAGAAAVVLGPPRGSLPGPDGVPVQGRLYGPALFPFCLQAVESLAGSCPCALIAGCGLYRASDAGVLLAAGASAVQFDTVLWTEPEAALEPSLVGGFPVEAPERETPPRAPGDPDG